MEIVGSTKGREGRDKEFKIDLIVWKLLSDIKESVLNGKFK